MGQLRKRWWKNVRNEIPCQWCFDDKHATKDCPKVSKSGKRKNKEERW
jgi:hypothetical protein